MTLPVTILYGTLSILVTLALALNISLHRMRHQVGITGEVTEPLHRKVRAHGNSTEWLAVTTLLLAFLELQGVSQMALHVLGGAMLVARIVHSLFMLSKSRFAMLSATTIYALSFVMGAWSLVLRLRG